VDWIRTNLDGIRTESRGAVGLLTRLPIGGGIAARPGAAAFGVVGAVVGLIAAVPFLALAGLAHEPVIAAIAAVAVLVVLTGAMHLDGLADTADALVAPDATAAERARKDPGVGPGGVITVVLTVLAEVAALTSIAMTGTPLDAAWTIVVAAGMARVAPVLLVRAGTPGAPATGLGSWFVSQVTVVDAVIGTGTVAVLVALMAVATTTWLALGTLTGAVLGLAVAWAVIARRGGPDGDSLGASVEITFVAILATAAIVVN
jgi:adenosylcobinamide-GDP ribazoletransferase